MFVSYDVSGPIKGLLVGVRRTELDDWRPAIGSVTVTAVVSRGLRLPVRAWQDFTHDEIAWSVHGSACPPFCVYVRNDGREMVELRAVVVLQGDAEHGGSRRRRLHR